MKSVILFLTGLFLFTITGKAQTVTDIEGNTYNTITIGTQTWMKENLKTTHFNNGTPIPTTTLPIYVDTTSIFQFPYNDDTNNINVYGRLYTWFSLVTNDNVCPSGWHAPSDTEWVSLTNFLGGDSVAGGKMKETGITHWIGTDSTVNNSSFFTGLPGGFRGNPDMFLNIGSMGMFWSSTPWGSATFQRGYCFNLNANNSNFTESVALANCGLSVRCIKDLPLSTGDIKFNIEIQVFPNPANNKITISFTENVNASINIYDVSGRLQLESQFKNQNQTIISVNDLHSGIYFVKISVNGKSVIKKISISE
ncbi:MAG: FISUMP domain-containing protein [Bacteroidia bacterium]